MIPGYFWCTYREWSFRILEGLLDMSEWKPLGIITTKTCQYNFEVFEKRGIPVWKINPSDLAAPTPELLASIKEKNPRAMFFYGWSWLVPDAVLNLCPNVTLHPGKLPKDRGGSPIQNQIRNGERETRANVLLMSSELDAGPVYDSETISLEGDSADDVWSRMTASGLVVTRRFLKNLLNSNYAPKEQSKTEPSFYKRVRPEQAELKPGQQTALEMYNVVRAHDESDPNSYVRNAFVVVNGTKLVIERATLANPKTSGTDLSSVSSKDLIEICARVNNGTEQLYISDKTGAKLFLKRFYISQT